MKKLSSGSALVAVLMLAGLALANAQDAKAGTSDAKAKAGTTQKASAAKRTVLDRPAGEKPAPYIVPAGTEIRVDVVEGKVIVPVRVGFATPIPALSKVAVQVNRVYAPAYLDANGVRQDGGNASYAEYGVLTAVTVDGVTYPVQSNSVPLASAGSMAVTLDNSAASSVHDVKFVLSASLSIAR